MSLVVVGLNHRTAPVKIRERFAIPDSALGATAEVARARGCTESFVISTCNRVEVYGAGPDLQRVDEALAAALGEAGDGRVAVLRDHCYHHSGDSAIRHLFRVAASLDSMVVGEPQILGQMKAAFRTCREAGLTGPALNRAVERAFAVAKRVRSQTGIGRAVVSISSVAVDLAKQIFGDLQGRGAVLVGAGKMGELAARNLVAAGVEELWVANRSHDRAQRLAETLGGHARDLDELPRLLLEADIVITSTGARSFLIDKRAVKKAMRGRKYRPIFFIDIAVPRNVDPAANRIDNVFVYDVDDLTGIADENLAERRREAEAAETMVAGEAERFVRELAGAAVKPTIVALRRKVQRLKAAEVERALKGLDGADPKTVKAVERMADAIVNKMLHDVMTGLKTGASEGRAVELVELTRHLFALDERSE